MTTADVCASQGAPAASRRTSSPADIPIPSLPRGTCSVRRPPRAEHSYPTDKSSIPQGVILMIRLTVVILAALTLTATATAATSDPRVCSAGKPTACALAAAKLAARRHVGGPGGLWQGPSFTCTLVRGLRFTCPLAGQRYVVVFTRPVAGWKVTVTP